MAESKGIRTLYAWLLRIALPVLIFYFNKGLFKSINLTDSHDLIMLASLILAVLILVGDFFKGESLTRVSALVLVIIAVIGLFIIKGILMFWIFVIFASLYFLIYGNKA